MACGGTDVLSSNKNVPCGSQNTAVCPEEKPWVRLPGVKAGPLPPQDCLVSKCTPFPGPTVLLSTMGVVTVLNLWAVVGLNEVM